MVIDGGRGWGEGEEEEEKKKEKEEGSQKDLVCSCRKVSAESDVFLDGICKMWKI